MFADVTNALYSIKFEWKQKSLEVMRIGAARDTPMGEERDVGGQVKRILSIRNRWGTFAFEIKDSVEALFKAKKARLAYWNRILDEQKK